MRPILSYQRYQEDFYGVPRPERGFYVNVYLYSIGTKNEKMGHGNLWPTRSEARESAREQTAGERGIKCVYRIRVKPKGPIPNRPPPQPIPHNFFPPYRGFYPTCPCQAQHMRNFR